MLGFGTRCRPLKSKRNCRNILVKWLFTILTIGTG